MDFLKEKFNEELFAEIEDNGNVKIADSSFSPDKILIVIDPVGYKDAFSDWLDERKKRLSTKADDILELYDNQGRFNRLRDAYKRGAVIPFIGAGMSIPSGYPGWSNFLRQLCKETRVSIEDLDNL